MILMVTDDMAKKIVEQHVKWLHTFCKPITSEICERCKHNGSDHRVAAMDSEYRSPCYECDCDDFVFSDKKKQALHSKLLTKDLNK